MHRRRRCNWFVFWENTPRVDFNWFAYIFYFIEAKSLWPLRGQILLFSRNPSVLRAQMCDWLFSIWIEQNYLAGGNVFSPTRITFAHRNRPWDDLDQVRPMKSSTSVYLPLKVIFHCSRFARAGGVNDVNLIYVIWSFAWWISCIISI